MPDVAGTSGLRRDPVLRAATERWLQVAVEACVDIAYHVVASEGWTSPTSARDAFRSLATHGRIDADLVARLGLAAGLRNVLVHDYADVDLELIARAVREDLGDVRTFAAAMASLLS